MSEQTQAPDTTVRCMICGCTTEGLHTHRNPDHFCPEVEDEPGPREAMGVMERIATWMTDMGRRWPFLPRRTRAAWWVASLLWCLVFLTVTAALLWE